MTDIQEHETIWFPGIYPGRQEEPWTTVIHEFLQKEDGLEELIALVQQRANEDGEWTIENGFVGPNNQNEPNMRKMMAWVADEENIRQCIDANLDKGVTVDWVCRDLANGSKWVAGSRG